MAIGFETEKLIIDVSGVVDLEIVFYNESSTYEVTTGYLTNAYLCK